MSDSEDEVQDWLALSRVQDAAVLKRGEKDFAPDGTHSQQSVLERSRHAMYDALNHPRATSARNLVYGVWDPVRDQVRVDKPKGTHFFTMGTAERTATFLDPEEAVYLAQRGSLQVMYNNNPLSIEGVCAFCMAAVHPENMLVYSYLKKLGYIVRRAPPLDMELVPGSHFSARSNGFWFWITQPWHKQLVWRSVYRSYSQVYRDLTIIGTAQPPEVKPINAHYHVYKPGSQFKKSKPLPPDFYVRVVDARRHNMPTLAETRALFAGVPETDSAPKRSPITRIKQGKRQLVLAVVDAGVVSFVRLVDTEFERLPPVE